MGLFSWTTSDTEQSIMNKWSKNHRVVYLLTPTKNIKCISYGGYGDFTTDKGFLIKLGKQPWITDKDGNECMSYKGLPLKFSFDPRAKYNELKDAGNCPLQGHNWGNSTGQTYPAIDDFSIKGRAGNNTGENTRSALIAALDRGIDLKTIAKECDRSVSTMRQIKAGSIKNPPANLMTIINDLELK